MLQKQRAAEIAFRITPVNKGFTIWANALEGGGWDKVRNRRKDYYFSQFKFFIFWGGGRDKNQPARYHVPWQALLLFLDLVS